MRSIVLYRTRMKKKGASNNNNGYSQDHNMMHYIICNWVSHSRADLLLALCCYWKQWQRAKGKKLKTIYIWKDYMYPGQNLLLSKRKPQIPCAIYIAMLNILYFQPKPVSQPVSQGWCSQFCLPNLKTSSHVGDDEAIVLHNICIGSYSFIRSTLWSWYVLFSSETSVCLCNLGCPLWLDKHLWGYGIFIYYLLANIALTQQGPNKLKTNPTCCSWRSNMD